jgi:hypothetical protein
MVRIMMVSSVITVLATIGLFVGLVAICMGNRSICGSGGCMYGQ